MKKLTALSLLTAIAFLSVGAVSIPNFSNGETSERRRGICSIPIPGDPLSQIDIPGMQNKATRYSHQNAIDWTVRPIIENGHLLAEGTVKGNQRLANNPPGGFATFALKRRNTDISIAAIVAPLRGRQSYTGGSGHIIASEWDVTSTSFHIKAPAHEITEPADLLVWGESTIKPLSIHSVEGSN